MQSSVISSSTSCLIANVRLPSAIISSSSGTALRVRASLLGRVIFLLLFFTLLAVVFALLLGGVPCHAVSHGGAVADLVIVAQVETRAASRERVPDPAEVDRRLLLARAVTVASDDTPVGEREHLAPHQPVAITLTVALVVGEPAGD